MCNSTTECVEKFRVPLSCFFEGEERSRCDCHPLYGWQGEVCDEPSLRNYILRSTFVLLTIWCLVNIGRVFFLVAKFRKLNKRVIAGIHRVKTILALSFIALCLILTGFIMFLDHYIFSSGFDLIILNGQDFIGKSYTSYAYYILYMPLFPHCASFALKVLNWFSIMKKIVYSENQLLLERRIVKFFYILTPMTLVVVPVLLGIEQYLVALAYSVVVAFIGLVLYCYMLNSFLKPLGEIINNSSASVSKNWRALKDSYNFVLFTNRYFVLFALFLTVFAGLQVVLVSGFSYLSKDYSIQPANVFLVFYSISALAFHSFEAWYVAKLIANYTEMDSRSKEVQFYPNTH